MADRDVAQTIEELVAILGPDAVVSDPAALGEWSSDRGDDIPVGAALAAVFPTNTEQVSAVMRLASQRRVPVVPQGTRTGVTGAANAVDGSILLNLSRANRIIDIDVDDQLATVQPGVIVADLAAASAAKGLFYPVDPGSVRIATIGGTIATGAGGMRCVKYGVTSDFVRALTVVLADGTVVRTGHRTVKGVAGYDITRLLVASEGTLGIVTEATLALLPAPGDAAGAAAMFPSLAAALEASAAVMATPYRPSALELLDAPSMAAINEYDPTSALPEGAAAMLIIESDEIDRAAADVERYVQIFREHGATEVRTASTPAEVDRLLNIRRNLYPGLLAKYGTLLTEDIGVPRGGLLRLLQVIERAGRETGAQVATGGHVGDGNLHPIISYDAADPQSKARAERAFEVIIEETVRLGGTVTGEHGVGVLKRSSVAHEFDEPLLALQRRVKAAFDPQGILNPGKKLV